MNTIVRFCINNTSNNTKINPYIIRKRAYPCKYLPDYYYYINIVIVYTIYYNIILVIRYRYTKTQKVRSIWIDLESAD